MKEAPNRTRSALAPTETDGTRWPCASHRAGQLRAVVELVLEEGSQCV